MITEIFSVYDVKAQVFGLPFFVQNQTLAKRSVMAAVRDETNKGMLSQFPEDFDLYSLGHFDDATGVITPLATPFCVCKCASLIGGSNAS